MSTERTGTRVDVVDLVFAAALTSVALYAFESSFGTLEFMIVGLVGVAFGAAVAAVGVWRRIDALYLAIALFAGYVLIGGTIALRDEATAGFLPSAATMRGALDGSVLSIDHDSNQATYGRNMTPRRIFEGGVGAVPNAVVDFRDRLEEYTAQ